MTPTKMQNPGGQAGASRDCFGGLSHPFPTASGLQAQMLASRFCLSPWMAREMARLCFGEGGND
jgi:hypothetical protein